MKKQIKKSIDELYQEQLRQQKSVKRKKQPRTIPVIVTLFLSAAVVLIAVIQLTKAPNLQNEEAMSNGNNQDINTVQEVTPDYREETIRVKKSGTVTFYNENDIYYLKEVFQQAEQLPGIANMATPQYKVQLGKDGELFFLWFNEDHSATLMESEVTDTIYQIRSAEKIEKMLQESLAFSQFMAEIEWETGMVSMVKPFDRTFTYDSIRYQLWLNEEQHTVTLVPVENNVERWVTLNESDTAKLMNYLETTSMNHREK